MLETKLETEKKILIYSRGELLGDGLLKLPSLSVLKQAFPDHKIDWCAGCGNTVYAGVLKPLVKDYLDVVIENVSLGKSWLECFQKPSVPGPYEIIIDTQNILRCSLLLRRVPHQQFISPAAGFYFSDRRPESKSRKLSGSIPNRLLSLFKLASGKDLEIDFSINLPDGYRQRANELLPEGKTYVGFAPGAGGKRKCWPLEKFIEVAKQQESKNRQPVFFLGPAEEDMLPVLKQVFPEALFPEQENEDEQFKGPLLSIALAKRTSVSVSNDSGTGHILSVSGSPLISLFGHTSSEKFVEPHGKRIVIQASEFGGNEIDKIPVEKVVQSIDGVLL